MVAECDQGFLELTEPRGLNSIEEVYSRLGDTLVPGEQEYMCWLTQIRLEAYQRFPSGTRTYSTPTMVIQYTP
uniref:Uncharacterized protein n=1 Tax=Caenorhabditis tropicalis TaxID=1561998 RepID=A0A1I7T9X8_9PELO